MLPSKIWTMVVWEHHGYSSSQPVTTITMVEEAPKQLRLVDDGDERGRYGE
jgi:hypothetical protein